MIDSPDSRRIHQYSDRLKAPLRDSTLLLPICSPRLVDMASPQRHRPMEVLCLGLPRTGTMTLQHALLQLGYRNVWHGDPVTLKDIPADSSAVVNELAIKKFRHGKRIARDELERLLWDFDATTDIPPCYFWDDMMAAYPDAKVILVEREVESWYRSCVSTLLSTLFNTWHGLINRVFAERILGAADETMLKNLTFGFFRAETWTQLQRNARQVYVEHYASVRKACEEQDRPLLDFKLSDGWPKLCEFLDKEVPKDVQFPRTNDGHSLNTASADHHWRQIRVALFRVLKWTVVPGTAVALGAWQYTRNK